MTAAAYPGDACLRPAAVPAPARGLPEQAVPCRRRERPSRVGRRFVCPCRGGTSGAKSVAALDFGGDGVAPELAYVTARYAAMAPFGKVAALLSELLPIGGARHAGTARNGTPRVGTGTVQANTAETANQPAALAPGPVVVGLDGGYVRHRHRTEGAASRWSRAR